MKRKCILLLILLCVANWGIFLSCKQEKLLQNNIVKSQTCLIIKNHSSVNVQDITYNGKKFQGILNAGEVARIVLDSEGEGYVFFSIDCSVHDEKNDKKNKKTVKSADFVVVEKNEEQTFSIIDNTLVIPMDETKASPIIGLVRPTKFTVINHTFSNIDDISFYGNSSKVTLLKEKQWTVNFTEEVPSSELSFTLWNAENKAIKVKLKDRYGIEIGKEKQVTLNNFSLVFVEDEEKPKEIREVLHLSIMTIVNDSGAKVSNLRLASQNKTDALDKDIGWQVFFFDNLEDVLTFEVKTNYKTFVAKCEEKIICKKGEVKSFKITNDTSLKIEEREKPITLHDLLNVSRVILSNKSKADLIEATYANLEIGTVEKNGKKELLILDFAHLPSHFEFSIFQPYSGKNVKLKTQQKFSVAKGQDKTFEITDENIVLKDNSNVPYILKNLINGDAILTIENRSSSSLYDIKFQDKVFGKAIDPKEPNNHFLEMNSSDSKQFQYDTEDYVCFFAYNCEVHSQEKVKIAIGENKNYVVNNETLVIPEGYDESIKLWKLKEGCKVSIINETSKDIKNVSYSDFEFATTLKASFLSSHVFLNIRKKTDYITFELPTTPSPVRVRTVEKFSMEKSEHVKFKITNETLVVKEGENEEVAIKNLLGVSTLKVINQTSAKETFSLSYASAKYDDILLEGAVWQEDFDEVQDDYLKFNVKVTVTTFNVKTKDKISLTKGEEKTFFLNDESEVIVEGESKSCKIKQLVDAAQLKIVNDTCANILYIEYENKKYEKLLKGYSSISIIYWDYSEEATPILFDMHRDGIERKKFKTVYLMRLTQGQSTTYTISNKTEVFERHPPNSKKIISQFLEISTLKVLNQTVSILKDFKYAHVTKEATLAKNEVCAIDVIGVDRAHLEFSIAIEGLGDLRVRTEHEVVLTKNGETTLFLSPKFKVVRLKDDLCDEMQRLQFTVGIKIINATSVNLYAAFLDRRDNAVHAFLPGKIHEYYQFLGYHIGGKHYFSFEIETKKRGTLQCRAWDYDNNNMSLNKGRWFEYKITDETKVEYNQHGTLSGPLKPISWLLEN